MADRESVMKIARIVFPLAIGLSIFLLWLQKNETHYILAILYRLIAFVLLIGSFIFATILVSVFGSARYIYLLEDWEKEENQYRPKGYDKEKYNVLFDSHFHTIWSDGKMTIEQGIKWHIACGFNAFAVTDHGVIKNRDEILQLQEKYKDQCIILPGVELDSFNGHLNIIGYKNWPEEKVGKLNSIEEIKEVVEIAHNQGAVITWNHYPWSYGGDKPRYKNPPARKEVLSWGVDFIEASNWDDDIDTIDMKSYDFCKTHDGISPIAGTDVHSPEKNKLWAWTLIKVENFTPKSIMKELRDKRTEILFEPNGIPYPTKHNQNPTYQIFRPFFDIGDMFVNLHQGSEISNVDWKSIRMWIIFILLIFILFEIIYGLFL